MEPLIIVGTEKTPEIRFTSQTGKLYIGGRSYSSDAFDFYKPITAWINEYILNPNETTIVEINVDYFHSVSVKYLTSIIKKVAHLQEEGKSVKVIWFHQADDDEDEAYDLGKNIEIESKLKFEYSEVSK
ncbi:MAG TPA: DUF1987 domain-containing protein [Bacteroidia bacterium]|jgi:hypothetical protein